MFVNELTTLHICEWVDYFTYRLMDGLLYTYL